MRQLSYECGRTCCNMSKTCTAFMCTVWFIWDVHILICVYYVIKEGSKRPIMNILKCSKLLYAKAWATYSITSESVSRVDYCRLYEKWKLRQPNDVTVEILTYIHMETCLNTHTHIYIFFPWFHKCHKDSIMWNKSYIHRYINLQCIMCFWNTR